MKDMFIQVVALSLSAALIAALVMALRLALRKSPRFIVCALWALVAVRLLIPVLPESKVSVVPSAVSSGSVVEEVAARPVEPVVRVSQKEPRYVKIIEKTPQIPVKYEAGEAYVEVSEKTLDAPKTVGTSIVPVLAWIWLGGTVLMMGYMLFSYLRIWRKVRISVRDNGNVYLCDTIASPFILGMFRPKIYIPSELAEKDKAYVMAHEQAHLKRLDHVWKPLGWLLLSVHWFNPVMWAAYILLCRDIEMACDEKVTGREGDGFRKAYSEALLACSMPARLVTACPLAFGEVGVKTRIRSVLNYKRPAFWILAVTLAACLIAAGCALTNPTQPATTPDQTVAPTDKTETPTDKTDAPTDPSVQPTATQEPATEPGPTDPTVSPDIPRGKTREIPSSSDQEGVMMAERVRRWDTSYSTRVYPAEDGFHAESLLKDGIGPADAAYERTHGYYLLDRVNSRLFYAPSDTVVYAKSLDFCPDPLMLQMVWEADGVTSRLVPYILNEEALWRLPLADEEWQDPAEPTYETVALPAGVRGQDVLDLLSGSANELILVTDGRGNYLLSADKKTWEPTTRGYQINREGDLAEIITKKATWTARIPAGDEIRVIGEPDNSLTFCVIPQDSKTATVYYTDAANGYLYESTVDMSDWYSIPARFISRDPDGPVVLAPRESGIDIYNLNPGVSSVYAEGPKEDLTARRADILAGEVLPLYGGNYVDENYRGFMIDMDGDGTVEEIGIAPGLGNDHALTWELTLNGRPAGISWMNYAVSSAYGSPYTNDQIQWPEEGNFSREGHYQMYLSTLDGEHILLFLEVHDSSNAQIYGLDFMEYRGDETLISTARTRIRRYTGSMETSFTPNLPLAEYIARGWLVRPADGDKLDVNGDGKENTVRVVNHLSETGYPIYYSESFPFNKESMKIGECWPYSEFVAVDGGEAYAVVHQVDGRTDDFGAKKLLSFRYGDLYYAANDLGGYDLIGELCLNGATVAERYRLTDPDDVNPATASAKDVDKAGFRVVSGWSHPLPGSEEWDELILRYFRNTEEAAGGAPVFEWELKQLDRIFGDAFAGHFLLDEYEDVRDIDLSLLYYDGLRTGAAPQPGIVVTGDEEAEVLALMGETHALQPLWKMDRQATVDAFRTYTGYNLSEASGGIPYFYVEKYDAWYYLRSDTAMTNYRIVDAYNLPDGSCAVLWQGRSLITYGIVTLRWGFGYSGFAIRSNRVITDQDVDGFTASGVLRAAGTKVLDYGSADVRDHREIEWNGSPVLPADFSYSSETGMLILDRLGKRLIYQNAMGETGSAALDFCTDPERMALYGGYIYILDGAEVLELKSDLYHGSASSDAELLRRVPLPDGVQAADVQDMYCTLLPGTAEPVLVLIAGDQGNYQFWNIKNAFEPTGLGWHMERQGTNVHIWADWPNWGTYGVGWDLEIPAGDVRIVDMQNNDYGKYLLLYVREANADQAELRRYDLAGRLEAVSRIDLSDLVQKDAVLTDFGDSWTVAVHRYDGLYRYSIQPGVNHLEREPLYFDLHTKGAKEESILQGEIVDLSFMEPVYYVGDRGTGVAIDLDQDGTVDTISLEPGLTPDGRQGLEFYYNGQPAGASRTLYRQGQVTENEEPAFFAGEDGYEFYLASLDGKKIDLIMSNQERTLAVEFVRLEPDVGAKSSGGYFARVRMRGEGKTIADFVPCRGIQKYLEDGWEVRPSEGDVLESVPGTADGPLTVHMAYRLPFGGEGSFYLEQIRLGDSDTAVNLGTAEGEYDLIRHRFDRLTYARSAGGGPFTSLSGWMEDGSHRTWYEVDTVDGVPVYKEAEGGRLP
ncbi:MAG: M56 family metallopeptidase [Lachnospiraceae bacterium]|nr:M56 family metallopeptidase [Lachnospiraceae bacterium]